MVAKRFGSDKPKGTVNNVRVTCRHCKSQQFVKPRSGSWKCMYCKKSNG